MKAINLHNIPDDVQASMDAMGVTVLHTGQLDTETFVSLYSFRMNNLERSISEENYTGDKELRRQFIAKFRKSIGIIEALKPAVVNLIHLQSAKGGNYIVLGADGTFVEMIQGQS